MIIYILSTCNAKLTKTRLLINHNLVLFTDFEMIYLILDFITDKCVSQLLLISTQDGSGESVS